MKKRIVCILLSAMMAFSLAACGNGNGDTDTQDHGHNHNHEQEGQNFENAEVVLKVALSEKDGEIHYESVQQFANEVNERTDGKVAVEIIGGEKAGAGKDVVNGMAHAESEVDIVVTKLSDFTEVDARMDISALPFLFANEEDALRFMNGNIQSEIEDALIAKNIRVLTHYSGEFHALTSKTAVTNAQQIQQLAFVTDEGSADNKSMQALGVRVTAFEKDVIMQVLDQGQSDGYVGSFTKIQSSHLYQSQEFVVMTNHHYEGVAFAISETSWRTLSQEYQTVIQEAARHSAYIDKDATEQMLNEAISRIESSGVKVLYPDTKSFREKMENMIRSTYTQYGNLLDRVMMEYYAK